VAIEITRVLIEGKTTGAQLGLAVELRDKATGVVIGSSGSHPTTGVWAIPCSWEEFAGGDLTSAAAGGQAGAGAALGQAQPIAGGAGGQAGAGPAPLGQAGGPTVPLVGGAGGQAGGAAAPSQARPLAGAAGGLAGAAGLAAAAVGGGPAAVSDDFAGTGALSANWTTMGGYAAGTRSSGHGQSSTAGSSANRYTGATFNGNQYSQAFHSSMLASYATCFVAARMQSGSDSFYYVRQYSIYDEGLEASVAVYAIVKRSSGSESVLATYQTEDAPGAQFIRLEATGTSTVTLTVKTGATAGTCTTVRGTATDSNSPLSGGFPGWVSISSYYVDDWTGGDL
jgi:hypothetical protein